MIYKRTLTKMSAPKQLGLKPEIVLPPVFSHQYDLVASPRESISLKDPRDGWGNAISEGDQPKRAEIAKTFRR